MARRTTGKTTNRSKIRSGIHQRGRSIKTRATAKKVRPGIKGQRNPFEAVMREAQRRAVEIGRGRPADKSYKELSKAFERAIKRMRGRPLRTEKEGWGTGRGRNTPPRPLRTEKEGWGYTLPKSPHKTVTKIPRRRPRYDI